jgi:hypothetical protein
MTHVQNKPHRTSSVNTTSTTLSVEEWDTKDEVIKDESNMVYIYYMQSQILFHYIFLA